jgi:PIN domain nuclease of toxin-antitoxin system
VITCVADTHAAIWYLFHNDRLSVTARRMIEDTAVAGDQVGVSAITVAELVYLVEKVRIDSSALTKLTSALRDPANVLHEVLLDSRIAETMARVPRAEVPDFPDRIIAATALSLDVPLISRDARIRASHVRTVW